MMTTANHWNGHRFCIPHTVAKVRDVMSQALSGIVMGKISELSMLTWLMRTFDEVGNDLCVPI